MIFDYLYLGKRVKYYRLKMGISQMTLAEMLGCDTSYISYIETGKKCMSLQMFVCLANTLSVSANELLVDCLCHNTTASELELAEIMSDCTLFERRILTDLVKASKESIRKNASLL